MKCNTLGLCLKYCGITEAGDFERMIESLKYQNPYTGVSCAQTQLGIGNYWIMSGDQKIGICVVTTKVSGPETGSVDDFLFFGLLASIHAMGSSDTIKQYARLILSTCFQAAVTQAETANRLSAMSAQIGGLELLLVQKSTPRNGHVTVKKNSKGGTKRKPASAEKRDYSRR